MPQQIPQSCAAPMRFASCIWRPLFAELPQLSWFVVTCCISVAEWCTGACAVLQADPALPSAARMLQLPAELLKSGVWGGVPHCKLAALSRAVECALRCHPAGCPGAGKVWLNQLFQGKFINETKCLQCETVTSREEDFYEIPLEIEQNCSLTSCLRRFRCTHWCALLCCMPCLAASCCQSLLWSLGVRRLLLPQLSACTSSVRTES